MSSAATALTGGRLDALLAPRAVAIVGASERNHHGKQAADSLTAIGFAGPVYYINPSRKEVWGKPCHPDLKSTPTPVDTAILVVNRERVLEVVRQCAEAGVRGLVINSDGFGEAADPSGRDLQRDLVALVRKHDLLLCGPNCLGMMNFHAKVAAYCGPVRSAVKAGNLSFISQSGGNSASFIELADARGIGLSYLVSTGNEAGLDTCDYLEHVIADPQTAAICLLLETIRDPRRFLGLAARAIRVGKPVIAIKLGRSQAARMAAVAHTGALAGSDDAVNALFARAGVIRAATIDEAVDQCALFCLVPRAQWLRGSRLGVFTVGGGLAGLISDLAQDRGLEVPPLPAAIKALAVRHLPVNVNVQNPFDVPGPYITEKPKLAYDFVRGCVASDEYDAVVMLRSMPGAKNLEYLYPLDGLPAEFGKPIFAAAPIDSGLEDFKRAFMARSKLTLVTGLNRLVIGLDAMLRFHKAHEASLAAPAPAPLVPRPVAAATRAAITQQRQGGRKVLSHAVTYDVLGQFGLPVVPQQVVASAAEAVAFAESVGFPVVAKLVNSEAATHKTELGAIHVGLANAADLAQATDRLLRLVADHKLVEDGQPVPVLVQKMVAPAIEMFVGATVPSGGYPPLVLVGAGGIFVEVLRDVVRGIAPLTEAEALAMIRQLKTWPLLDGFRGRPKYDVAALARALVALGDMVASVEDVVVDIDLNPILVRPVGQGAVLVDAVVALAPDAAA